MVSSPFHFWAGSSWAHGRLLDLQHFYSALSLGNFSLLGFVGFCETSKRAVNLEGGKGLQLLPADTEEAQWSKMLFAAVFGWLGI